MERRDMIRKMARYYKNGNKAAFARMLGISPQTLNSWCARNIFDAILIYEKCDGISAKWLLTGEGDMLEKRENISVTQEVKRDNYGEMMIGLGELTPEIKILKTKIHELESLNELLKSDNNKLEKRNDELAKINSELSDNNNRLVKILTDYTMSRINNSNE